MSPTDEEGMEPLERGRSRYQQKDYAGALQAFTEAIGESTGHLEVNALDHRAATYEKLDNLQAALRDSKRMLDIKPEVAKGYLRCAKVLRLKGEHQLALQIYERGLKKVKIGTDSERGVLQAMYTKMKETHDPSKCLDPLVYLPIEMIELIVEHLAIRERVICLAVSRSWKRILESEPKLWTTFDTTSTRRNITEHSLKTYLRRSNYEVDRALISSRAKLDTRKMEYLTRTCKLLRHLEFYGHGVIGESLNRSLPLATNLRSLILSENYEISLASAMYALDLVRETIELAVFSFVRRQGMSAVPSWPKMNSLKVFNIRMDESHHDFNFDLGSFRNAVSIIESISIVNARIRYRAETVNLTNLKHLSFLELRNIGLYQMPLLPPSLKHLNVNENQRLRFREADPLNLPLLQNFFCEGTNLDGVFIKAVIESSIKAGNLQTLHIGQRLSSIPAQDKEHDISQSVTELSLCGLQHKEDILIQMANKYPNLHTLDLSYTKVTGVAVKHFVSGGIKVLKLNECSHLSSDAVTYARNKFVTVEFDFPSRWKRATAYRDAVGHPFRVR